MTGGFDSRVPLPFPVGGRQAGADAGPLAVLHELLARAEAAGVAASSLLLSAMARRDRALVARARRTAEWTLLLGEAAGAPDAGQDGHDIALLADVGVLALEPMANGGPWTEWRCRQAAHDVLAGVEGLRSCAPGVLTVAESFDGTGLPLGLGGDEIPLAARMARVARTFDERSGGWWPGMAGAPVTRACAHLVELAGTSLDPALVYAWLRLMDRHVSQGAA
jgi:hypothetical protein